MPARTANLSRRGAAWKQRGTLTVAVFAPGLLAGTQISGLLFFLNPDLPFGPRPLLRGVLVYGGLFGLLSTVLLLPWVRTRPKRAARALPWAVTAVLGLAAVIDWTQASHLAYLLPPGINVRLLKAALLLTLATVICFYTALLHTLHARPYGRRTRIGLFLLALASVYFMVERREAFRPQPEPTPLPSAVELEQRPNLIVVGIAGATLDAILPLAGRGRLPFFSALTQTGAYGHLESFSPARAAALWTTLATGKLPYKHGILGESYYPAGFLAPGARLKLLPAGMGFATWGVLGAEPVAIDAREGEALGLWDILQRLRVAGGLVGWPMTYPVPDGQVFAFSDRFFEVGFEPGNARPTELAERGELFRVGSEELDPSWRARFGPDPPRVVLEAMAEDLWRQSLTSFLVDQRRGVKAVYLHLPGLLEVSRSYFGGFSAAEFEGVHEQPYVDAGRWMGLYYEYLDAFLAELWERAKEPRLLAVVSAHGVEQPPGASRLWGELVRQPRVEGYDRGAPDGVLFMIGEGIRAGTFLTGAQLVDVVPTLLYGMGFPIALDLDGSVLTTAFESSFLARQALIFVPSYETLTIPAADSDAG